jgi:ABC-type antimicrobial peptide transport system permease subunit
LLRQLPNINTWESNEPFTFVELQPETSLETLGVAMTDIFRRNSKEEKAPTLFTRPFSSRYLYNSYENGVQSGGRITYVRLFSIIAFFILIIAVINFINLSTAQAANRVKEIGVRKVLGIPRSGLIIQFLGEAILLSLISLFVAVMVVALILPKFNEVVGKDINWLISPSVVIFFLILAIVTGLLSGIYPSLYLSQFQPGSLLSGKYTSKGAEKGIRQGLVIFQFTASVFLIVAVLVITNQIDFIHDKELGYNKEQVLLFKKEGNIKTNLNSFIQELTTIPGVVEATSADVAHITNNETSTRNVIWEGKDPSDKTAFKYILGNYNLIELLELDVVEGRSFSQEYSNEKEKIILNQTAVRQMGIKNPIGQTLKIWNSDATIVGIVNDFHFQSLYEEVQPLFMKISSKGDAIMVKIAGDSGAATIAQIESFYKEFNYGLPLEFRFLDSDYQQFYEAETRVAALSKYFGGLAIIISCLGLFGLITFSIGKRYKEIGVRKVLGASVSNIIILISKDFLKIIVLSTLIAIPIAWYAMNNWLQNFAYRIDLGADTFIIAGCIAISIATLTISFQVFKVAIINPVKTLRTE